MKKNIALILALVMAMSMSACCACDCDEQIAALQQEIATLKTQNDNQNQMIPEETVFEETVLEETIPEETVSKENEDVVWEEFLSEQANSDNPDNWLEVAECDFATENHLLEVAKKCATLDYYYYLSDDHEAQLEIAEALSDNPATTDAVMAELVNAAYPGVWKVVAQSDKSRENALLAVAKKCATLDYWYYLSDDQKAQVEIAKAISDNPATTDAVMAELVNAVYPEVWKVVAQSDKSRENALLEVAKKCANLDYYYYSSDDKEAQLEIAEALSKNPATTDAVMAELVDSEFSVVVSFAHKWIEEN